MYLNKPPWAEDLISSSASCSASLSSGGSQGSATATSSGQPCSSSASSATPLPRGVQDLVKTMNRQRYYREITLALRTALRDATAEFSFLRIKGLTKLLKFLASLPQSDLMIQLFRDTQTLPEFQVVPVLFNYSLHQMKSEMFSKSDGTPSQVSSKISDPTSDEVIVALRVLEGCCLLDRDCRSLAQNYMLIEEIVRYLSCGNAAEQNACIDALMALILDSAENQKDFEQHHGVRRVAELTNNDHIDEDTRLKCAEFLLMLIGNMSFPTISSEKLDEEEEASVMRQVHDDILEVLGEEIAPLLWAARKLGCSIDSEENQHTLHFHARQLLDCLHSKS